MSSLCNRTIGIIILIFLLFLSLIAYSLIKNLEIDIKETLSYLYNALLEQEAKAPGTSGIYGQARIDANPKSVVTKVKTNTNTAKANVVAREMDKYPGGKHDDIPAGYYYRNKFSYLHNYHFLLESIGIPFLSSSLSTVIIIIISMIEKKMSSNINSFPYTLTKTQIIFEEPPLANEPTKRRKQKADAGITIPPYTLKVVFISK